MPLINILVVLSFIGVMYGVANGVIGDGQVHMNVFAFVGIFIIMLIARGIWGMFPSGKNK